MSQKKNNFFSIYLIIVVLLGVSIYFLNGFLGKIDTSFLEFGELEGVREYTGIVIKDEKIVEADCIGEIEFSYEEGDKVFEAAYLADIHTADSTSQIIKEIEMIDSALENINSSIAMGSSSEVKYVGYEESDLLMFKQIYEQALNLGKYPVFSPVSGFLSYEFDGVEEHFLFEEALDVMPSKFTDLEVVPYNTQDLSYVETHDDLLKVISNYYYYIAFLVSNDDIELYSEGSYIRVRIDGHEDFIYGYIEKINPSNENSVVVVRFDDYFHRIYNMREVSAQLIHEINDGIIIDKRAVIEKDGLTGIYIVDISNIVKFFPIDIIGENYDFYVVDQGEVASEGSRGAIYIDEKKYYTVKAYDKAVLNPNNTYEGQIVD